MALRVESLTGRGRARGDPRACAAARHRVPRLALPLRRHDRLRERLSAPVCVRPTTRSIIAAYDGDAIVGAATGAPLGDHAEAFAKAFAERGLDIDRIFYCGESVLLPPYRGRGLGHAFFDRPRSARACARPLHAHYVLRRRAAGRSPAETRELPPSRCLLDEARLCQDRGPDITFAWKDIDQAGRDAKADAVLDEGALT